MKKLLVFITLLACVGFTFAQEEGNKDGSFIQEVQLDPSSNAAFGQNAQINWSEGTIQVRGAGTANAGLTLAQARLRATGAARADALRLLATTVNGVGITAETTVREYVLESDVVRVNLEAYLKGATFPTDGVEIEEMSDGSFIVYAVAELPLYGEGALTGAVLPDFQERNGGMKRGSHTLFILTEEGRHFFAAAAAANYTGVVFDATAFNVNPLLAPSIVSQSGQVVYGINSVAPAALAAQGGAGYYSSVQAAASDPRVGSSPLIVEVIGVSNGMPVISDGDAAALQQMGAVLQGSGVALAARGIGIGGAGELEDGQLACSGFCNYSH